MNINVSEIGLTGGGWYIAIGYRYLHKDFRLHSCTGYNGGMKWGSAPGCYLSEAIARAYLNEWFRKNDERGYEMKVDDMVIVDDTSYCQVYLNEWFRKNDERGYEMKVGDMVIVDDTSYCQVVQNGVLINGEGFVNSLSRTGKFKIVQMGCVFPSTNLSQRWSPATYNNTIIVELKTAALVFIEQRFLKLITHTIELDGKKIKLSVESYNNFKKQFQDD